MLRLRHRRYLFATAQSAAEAQVRPDIRTRTALQQLLILEYRCESLAGCDGYVALRLHLAHLGRAVRQHRILVEKRVELLYASAQPDGLGRIHLAVYLYADVRIVANRIAHHANTSHCLVCPLRIGLVQVVVRREWGEAYCCETRLLGTQRILCQIFASVADYMHVAPHFVTSLAAHQVVDGCVQTLALHVPQRYVYGRERTLDDRTHEV